MWIRAGATPARVQARVPNRIASFIGSGLEKEGRVQNRTRKVPCLLDLKYKKIILVTTYLTP